MSGTGSSGIMVRNSSMPSGQITFTQELARKATHMGSLVIPVGYYLLSLERTGMLAIMVPVTLLMILIDIARLRHWRLYQSFVGKIISPMVRSHEHSGDFVGATYILLSVCLTIAFYDKPVAIAALSFIAVGDSFAAVIGRKFGRHRFGRKSLEGSLGCLLGTLLVALIVPDLSLYVCVFGAFVATIVEALSSNIDDNISVPILTGLAMTLLIRISGSF